MKKSVFQFRYYLEMISLPVFIFLVTHLAGHGFALFINHGHEHSHHEHHGGWEFLFSAEILMGIASMALFTWLWHRPVLQRWVPCSHNYCQATPPVSHLLATCALCLHFFPEASIRHDLLSDALRGEMFNIVAMIGFGAHFVVDIIVALVLSESWKKRWLQWTSFGFITVMWGAALWLAQIISFSVPNELEGSLFVGSAFLLAMFIHKPCKPQSCCSK